MTRIILKPSQKEVIKSLLTEARNQLRSLQEAKKISRELFSAKKTLSLLGKPEEEYSVARWQPGEEGYGVQSLEGDWPAMGDMEDTDFEEVDQKSWEKYIRRLPVIFREMENKLKDIFLQVKETLEGEKSIRSLTTYLWDFGREKDEFAGIDPLKHFLEEKKRGLSILKDTEDQLLFETLVGTLGPIQEFQSKGVKAYGSDLHKTLEPRIEILYHATTNLRNIVSKGFSLGEPTGLLGLGTEDVGVISFTHSKHYAKGIADSHKILAKIARGIITGKELLLLVKARNVLRVFNKELVTRGYVRPSGPSRKLEFNEPNLPGNKLKSFSDLDLIQNPKNVVNLYMIYLGMLSRTQKGFNPIYMEGNAIQNMGAFKRKSPKNIGVVACKVDILYPGVTYRSSEKEWKVPVPAVISCKRV